MRSCDTELCVLTWLGYALLGTLIVGVLRGDRRGIVEGLCLEWAVGSGPTELLGWSGGYVREGGVYEVVFGGRVRRCFYDVWFSVFFVLCFDEGVWGARVWFGARGSRRGGISECRAR